MKSLYLAFFVAPAILVVAAVACLAAGGAYYLDLARYLGSHAAWALLVGAAGWAWHQSERQRWEEYSERERVRPLESEAHRVYARARAERMRDAGRDPVYVADWLAAHLDFADRLEAREKAGVETRVRVGAGA